MDARAWTVRLAAAVGLAVALTTSAPAFAQTPTPTPTATPSGAPKILLAFDASGSMHSDDGNGTRKIDAAKDAAVSLLSTLPDTTQIGLRIFGGTLPSRPIAAACKDSRLVLPIGPLDRGQAEEQIRSFRARGRTPIAYALRQAASDLGTTGSRTIVLVSDGKDTCQPPSPCTVANEVSKGGVEMRIQAIGFNVDPESRKELECVASAGGGVYRDATDAASLREELRVLSTRALREYIPKGKPVKGGPTAQKATLITPGQYVDGMIPDSERWYAVDLRRGETLKASQSFIPPARLPEIVGAESSLDIVTPDFDIPGRQNSSASIDDLFQRRGYVDAQGVVSRPIGVGEQADPDEPFSKPGRYFLKVKLEDSDDKLLYDATGGKPYTSELAVEVLGRAKGEPPPKPEEKEPERQGPGRGRDHARGGAERGAARGRRRRARGARVRRRRDGAVEAADMRLALLVVAALAALPATARAQEGTPVVGGGSFNTAPLIKPGTYSDTVAAGETVYWKVTLQKGQVLHVRATVDTSEIETDVTASDYEEGLDNLDYHLDIHSPLREPLSDEIDYRDASTDLEGDDEAGAKTGEAVGPRALGYEQILATDYSNYKFPGPGDWYISLSASDSDIFPAEVPAELPIKLEITLEGQPEPSSADFAAKLPAPTATPTSDAPEPVEAQLVSGSAGPGDPTLTIALVAVLALLGGLGLGALASRLLVR